MLPEARIIVTVARDQPERPHGVRVVMIDEPESAKLIRMRVTVAQTEIAYIMVVFEAKSTFAHRRGRSRKFGLCGQGAGSHFRAQALHFASIRFSWGGGPRVSPALGNGRYRRSRRIRSIRSIR